MREERRLNVLARGRLRAKRGAEPRLSADGDEGPPRALRAEAQVSDGTRPAVGRLVAVLEPVLGCADLAEPPAPATLSWAPCEC